ncbi:DUF2971 domain-containing protein [Microvirga sp. CF3062]|uniref:DUF2971 domain-containing protein n=1 Tax=Microvirga sp. CF3062 TaxID=3110182 RepID=UPI002E771FFB|nr:DUF2971 domain-containing protein [Microvirga sp. CF3062]MEE1655010.1 DUF2971 domain-containing protein [Microvirga sp. CF3062]
MDDIKKRHLKVARVHDLNDPFEFEVATADRGVRRAFRAVKDWLHESIGILCFSRDWNDPVQWAHYADRHRGICLGFDIPREQLDTVIYSETLTEPSEALLQEAGNDRWEHFKQIISTKYIHWQYEKEERVYVDLRREEPDKDGHHFTDFSDEISLKEIIVGHRSTLTRDELKDALGDLASQVSLCKARLAFKSYTVVPQLNQSLW